MRLLTSDFRVEFEDRRDLSPEFDVIKPSGFSWGFELPKNVDFHVYLGRHSLASDVDYLEPALESADLLLFEGPNDDFLYDLVNSAQTDNDIDFKSECDWLKTNGDQSKNYHIALLSLIRAFGLCASPSDPPINHPIARRAYDLPKLWNKNNQKTYRDAEMVNCDERDMWLLHNIKKLVDSSCKYTDGERRQVVISRGASHFRFLRALEFQCEYNLKKSNGSAVVSSSVNLITGGVGINDIFFA